jgi:phosphoribosylglycinamide formyltransferase-1
MAYGVKVTGCTIHWVDSGVDTGPIIDQTPVRIEAGESQEHLHERIKVEERKLLVTTIAALADGSLTFEA